ncbi:MAG: HNH endonuclease signature motif containing protein [Sedimentisphaerales bacterium]
MITIPLTQNLWAIVDITDYEELSKHKWFAKKTTIKTYTYGSYYAARSKKVDGKVKTIYMHREITNCPDDKEVDHINRNTLDNRRENLRVSTRAENMANRTQAYRNHKHRKEKL